MRNWTSVGLALACGLVVGSCDWFGSSKKPLPGERIAVSEEERELKPDDGAARISVTLPRPAVNESWPQSGGYASAAMQHLETGDAPVTVWSADVGTGSGSDRRITAPPVIADGRVFVKDARGNVSAYTAADGKLAWRVELRPEKTRDADEFGGGVAYYAGRLFVTTGFAVVFALDPATGNEIWRSTVTAPVRGAPTVFADRVFAVSIDNHIHALAAVDGGLLWDFAALQEQAGMVGGPSPSASADVVVAPFSSGELVGLRIDSGRPIWNESLIGKQRTIATAAETTDIRGRPVIDRGRVFAIGNAGQVVAIDLRTGARLWDKPIGGLQTPWSAGQFVYVLSNQAEIVCLHRDDGTVKWVTPLTQFARDRRRDPIQWVGPVLVGDRLLVGSSLGELVAVSPYDGRPLGKVDLRDSLGLAPVVADRMIYVLTNSGRLIAMR
jgi:outer membrane protein assembly factor BamB